jgi:hypothetical protein
MKDYAQKADYVKMKTDVHFIKGLSPTFVDCHYVTLVMGIFHVCLT